MFKKILIPINIQIVSMSKRKCKKNITSIRCKHNACTYVSVQL